MGLSQPGRGGQIYRQEQLRSEEPPRPGKMPSARETAGRLLALPEHRVAFNETWGDSLDGRWSRRPTTRPARDLPAALRSTPGPAGGGGESPTGSDIDVLPDPGRIEDISSNGPRHMTRAGFPRHLATGCHTRPTRTANASCHAHGQDQTLRLTVYRLAGEGAVSLDLL